MIILLGDIKHNKVRKLIQVINADKANLASKAASARPSSFDLLK